MFVSELVCPQKGLRLRTSAKLFVIHFSLIWYHVRKLEHFKTKFGLIWRTDHNNGTPSPGLYAIKGVCNVTNFANFMVR